MKPPPEPSADFTEHTVSTRLVHEGRLLRVRHDEVRLPGGAHAWREYIEHPGAVVMMAFPEPGIILLERQYRYPLHRHFIELPAGKMEAGEPPLATARRELVEECGYRAATWWHVTTLHPCVGYANEVIEVYGARDLEFVGAQLDPGEHLEVFPARLEDALGWVRQGLVTDTKTIIGLLWWAQYGGGT